MLDVFQSCDASPLRPLVASSVHCPAIPMGLAGGPDALRRRRLPIWHRLHASKTTGSLSGADDTMLKKAKRKLLLATHPDKLGAEAIGANLAVGRVTQVRSTPNTTSAPVGVNLIPVYFVKELCSGTSL